MAYVVRPSECARGIMPGALAIHKDCNYGYSEKCFVAFWLGWDDDGAMFGRSV
jgi:hypothetical protein